MADLNRREVFGSLSVLAGAGMLMNLASCKSETGSETKDLTQAQQEKILKTSSAFSSKTPLTESRSLHIVDTLYSNADTKAMIGTTDVSSMNFWDTYLGAYSFVGATSGYRDITNQVVNAMKTVPGGAVVADLGCGLGQISLELLNQQAAKKVYLNDVSQYASKHWQTIFASDGRAVLNTGDMRQFNFSQDNFTGVVINNALFSLPDNDQITFVTAALNALSTPGSVLFMNEPISNAGTREGMRDFLRIMGKEFSGQLNKMTEFQFAMIADTNFEVFVSALASRTNGLANLVQQVRQSGKFQIQGPTSSFYGISQTTIFQKT